MHYFLGDGAPQDPSESDPDDPDYDQAPANRRNVGRPRRQRGRVGRPRGQRQRGGRRGAERPRRDQRGGRGRAARPPPHGPARGAAPRARGGVPVPPPPPGKIYFGKCYALISMYFIYE